MKPAGGSTDVAKSAAGIVLTEPALGGIAASVIRIALGARPRQVMRLASRRTTIVARTGVALGLSLGVAAARFSARDSSACLR